MKTIPVTLIALLASLSPAFAQNTQVKTDSKTQESKAGSKTTVTVEIDLKQPQPSDRSGLLVMRASSQNAAAFASLIGPKLSSKASSSGVSISPTENAVQAEAQMIIEARGRGATYLVDVTVAQFSTATATVFGQEQRRMAATLAWRVIDVSGANSAVASGEAKDFSLNDPVIPADEQSSALADSIATKAGEAIAAAFTKAPTRNINDIPVPVSIVADELSFPGLVIGADNVLRRTTENLQVKLTGFTLVVDGITVGTVSGDEPLYLPEGLHMVSLQRNGFEPWSQRVRVNKNLKLNPVIRPDEAGLARWRGQIAFMQGMTMGSKLDDAQIARIKADAQRLTQSGYKVDVKVERKSDDKSDIKVNAKELPENNVIIR
ncbi:MAG: hypothetical protein ACKORB_05640 [Opitutia bacterium]